MHVNGVQTRALRNALIFINRKAFETLLGILHIICHDWTRALGGGILQFTTFGHDLLLFKTIYLVLLTDTITNSIKGSCVPTRE